MAGPLHHNLRRDAAGEGETNERSATSVRTNQVVFRLRRLLSLSGAEADASNWLVEFTKFANFLEIVIHLLVGDYRKCQTAREVTVLVLVKDFSGEGVEVDWETVIRLLGCDVDVVSIDVRSLQRCHIRVAERGKGAEAEEVSRLGEGVGIVDDFLILFPLVCVQLDLDSICRDFKLVELQQFFFGEEDDGLLEDLEFRLNLTDLALGRIAFPHSPVEEPAEIEVVFLDGLLFHLRFHAQVADKGVDSVFVEPVEGISIDAGGEMLAESGPTFHCSGGPLVRDALFLTEFIKVFNG